MLDGILRVKKTKHKNPPKKSRGRRAILRAIFVLILLGLGTGVYIFGASYYRLTSVFRSGSFLVLFQNNAEIRSSGGFIGSYAVAEVQNFELQKLTFNTNIYALDHAFSKDHYVEPPPPLAELLKGETWALRDANYAASFPAASKDIISFYEAETGENIDAVVALNAQVIIDLLKISGPIYMPKYNLIISADNFYQETQYQVEKAYYDNPENWVLNEPKTILKDLLPEILSRTLKNKLALFRLIRREMTSKEILFYFKNEANEQVIRERGWGGEIPITSGEDYLYINSNSYSGNKSSLSIKQDIDYRVSDSDAHPGKFEVDLTLNRHHEGSYDWPDGKNTEWVRVFIAPGAELLGAQFNGRDVSPEVVTGEEEGKNFFGYKITTEPGQANSLQLSYLAPAQNPYRLLVQKQPGVVGNHLTVNFENKLLYNGVLDRDIMLR